MLRVSVSGNDLNDGATWGSSKRTIEAAMESSAIGDEIWVAEGAYEGVLQDDMRPYQATIFGGFKGSEVLRKQRDATKHYTYWNTFWMGADVTCLIDGLHLRGDFGYVMGHVTIQNCELYDAFAGASYGGAVRVLGCWGTAQPYADIGGTIDIQDCTFAESYGPFVQLSEGGKADLQNSRFLSSHVGRHGLIYSAQGEVNIDGCEFADNHGYVFDASVIVLRYSIARVRHSRFLRNLGNRSGAIDVLGGYLTVQNSLFASNDGENAASIVGLDATVYLDNCTLLAGSRHGEGPLLICDGYTRVQNCIIESDATQLRLRGGGDVDTNCFFPRQKVDLDGSIHESGSFVAWPRIRDGFGHLDRTSPCIDRGRSLPYVSDDIDGDIRASDGLPDVGADEFDTRIWRTLTVFVRPDDLAGYLPEDSIGIFVGASSDSMAFRWLPLQADGSFDLAFADQSTAYIATKYSHWLSKLASIELTQTDNFAALRLTNGDVSLDDRVDILDLNLVLLNYGESGYGGNVDLDEDRRITLFDLGIVLRNFGLIGEG